MKRLELGQVLKMVVVGILLILSGLSLEGCSKKKHGPPGGPGVGVGALAYPTAGCPVPGGASEVLQSTLDAQGGNNSVLTIYIVRQSPSQITMYADLLIRDVYSFGGTMGGSFTACFNPVAVNTYKQSQGFENIATNATMQGNGTIIMLYAGSNYISGRALLGTVGFQSQPIGYPGMNLTLVGLQ